MESLVYSVRRVIFKMKVDWKAVWKTILIWGIPTVLASIWYGVAILLFREHIVISVILAFSPPGIIIIYSLGQLIYRTYEDFKR